MREKETRRESNTKLGETQGGEGKRKGEADMVRKRGAVAMRGGRKVTARESEEG